MELMLEMSDGSEEEFRKAYIQHVAKEVGLGSLAMQRKYDHDLIPVALPLGMCPKCSGPLTTIDAIRERIPGLTVYRSRCGSCGWGKRVVHNHGIEMFPSPERMILEQLRAHPDEADFVVFITEPMTCAEVKRLIEKFPKYRFAWENERTLVPLFNGELFSYEQRLLGRRDVVVEFYGEWEHNDVAVALLPTLEVVGIKTLDLPEEVDTL